METGRLGDEESRGRNSSISRSVLGGIVAAAALGLIAAKLNVAGFAPVGLLPLAVGIALGAVVSWLAGGGVICRKRLVFATILLAILTVFAEHAWLYRDFCRQWREARASQAQVAMFRSEMPWSPREYFASEATPGRVALWCVDAALIVAAAVATVIAYQRWTVDRTTDRTTTRTPNP
jgi:hypothetical protein